MSSSLVLTLFALLACQGDTTPADSSSLGTVDTAPTGTGDTHAVDTGPPISQDADQDGSTSAEDCDDSDPAVHPGADELCNDVDDDCDGVIDEDDALDAALWYADADGDGYGLTDDTTTACDRPRGYSEYPDDCDDDDPRVHPGAVEDDCLDTVDYNCDGSVGWEDADGDLIPACEDCDDDDAFAFPEAPETCNEADDDCDGVTDEDAIDATTWYGDADGDGHGGTTFTEDACQAPDGYVSSADDCDDLDATSHPDGVETCDDADNDCDGATDEGVGVTWYGDGDGDGYGDPDSTTDACDWPADHASNDGDCDDDDPSAHPGGVEVCDGADNDCDGSADNSALDAADWFQDADSDGFGDPDAGTAACEAPSGDHVADDTDCDDGDASVNPDASEACDDVDEDCDGDVDEEASDASTFYADRDGDGAGDPTAPQEACDEPAEHASSADDCDDGDSGVYPGASETCDDVDEDCDGTVDEDAIDPTTWYRDDDGDGYGDPARGTDACDAPTDYLADDSDCDDSDAVVSPVGVESCDDADEDCDGTIDEEALDATTWYDDADNDGFGDPDFDTVSCQAPSGGVDNDGDCDDTDASVNPDAQEICDGQDNDCDGTAEADEDVLGDGEACAASSCDEIQDTRTDSPGDDVYWIDPTGSSAYEVWCDLSNNAGGWTLLGIYTNNDSANWLPASTYWTGTSTFGDATAPDTNADAKSQAFNDLPIDELMVMHYPSSTGFVSSTGCIGNQALLNIFQQDSQSDSDCAHSCGLATVNSPWSGQGNQASSLYFRCADTDASYTDPGGYWYAADNSFITTLDNGASKDSNFGLAGGENNDWVDWDQTTGDGGDDGDTTQVLLYGR